MERRGRKNNNFGVSFYNRVVFEQHVKRHTEYNICISKTRQVAPTNKNHFARQKKENEIALHLSHQIHEHLLFSPLNTPTSFFSFLHETEFSIIWSGVFRKARIFDRVPRLQRLKNSGFICHV